MLWARLAPEERETLRAAHRQRYYALSGYLYQEDSRNPHQARAIAWRELPNLLHSVHAALDAGDPDAVDFADNVNKFLRNFGLKQEAESLAAKAQAAAGEAGSRAWYLAQSNRGEQLLGAGQVMEAAKIFQEILAKLGYVPTYERVLTLHRCGRCFEASGQPQHAEAKHREALAMAAKLTPSDIVKRERGAVLTDLADVLAGQGKFAEARQAYLDSLAMKWEGGDKRGEGVVLGQLGTLAMREGNLAEAAERYRAALALFQQLREPAMEAVAWHQLGIVFEEARQWDEAERHFRESARIEEERGNLVAAARTWNQLAIVNKGAGKRDAAEMWFRKEIEVDRRLGNPKELAPDLNNLADLLQTQPGRLAEARKLAEEALAIKLTLDPGAAAIWSTYNILAQIAEKEAEAESDSRRKVELQGQARENRRLGREAKRNFAGTRYQLRQHAPLILGTVMAVQDHDQRKQFEAALPQLEQHGWTDLVAAIRRILAGERDADALCEKLDMEDSMIVEAILAGLADPSTLSDLLPTEQPKPE
jgi:tetratricopeptide (TPR) repeat protein